ncbi:lipase secretion chaperone [Arhodomonas sp. AD133]|uniref:lipase secretion chaperone n=1 Tax=Arhodomonas sp. AD133 TaxID=3415009 RepID=UPI003EC118A4
MHIVTGLCNRRGPDSYVRYRRAVADTLRPPHSTERLKEAFERRRALRQRILGPKMAAAFFGHEEPLDRYAIALRRWLNKQGARERVPQPPDRLRQGLPARLRRAHRQSRLPLTLRERVQRLRRDGADQARIHTVRAAMAGAAAARRLAELDRRRSDWRDRLAAYRRERDRLLSASGLAPEDRQAAVDALLRERFDPNEARRVRALERTDETHGQY